MNIKFDFEVDAEKEGMSIQLKGDAKKIVDEIRDFVRGRLIVYDHEMKLYPDGYVYIDIGKPEVRYYYPQELSAKLMGCFTEEDYKYITTKIYLSLRQQ